MKLLLDQNLSFRMIPRLQDVFPALSHVKDFDLSAVDDGQIWQFAREHGFAIVSKDADFMYRSLRYGHPPKFIYVQVGNCPTADMVQLMRSSAASIEQFIDDPVESMLVIT